MPDPTAPKAQADRARHLRQAEALDATDIDRDREALGRGPVALTALAAPGTPSRALAHFGPRIAASIARAGLLDAYRSLCAALAVEQRDYLGLALLGVRAPIGSRTSSNAGSGGGDSLYSAMHAAAARDELRFDAPRVPEPVSRYETAPRETRWTTFGTFTDAGAFVLDPDVARAVLDRAEMDGRPVPVLTDSEGVARSLALDLTAVLTERLNLDPSHDGLGR